jgi:molybdenum-dependent DNA-binding transcriptional regulator ModE
MCVHHGFDWSDLQFALAVVREGSLAGAARSLRINHSTVLRRIDAFERALGVRLFDRQPSGYVPTEAGEALAQLAREMAERVDAVERRVVGLDRRPTGSVRLSTTDTLVGRLAGAARHGEYLNRHVILRFAVRVVSAQSWRCAHAVSYAQRPRSAKGRGAAHAVCAIAQRDLSRVLASDECEPTAVYALHRSVRGFSKRCAPSAHRH